MNDMTAAEGGLFARPNVVSHTADDGTIYLSSGYTLPVASGRVTDWLVDGADAHPDRVFLAERMCDGWRSVTYAQALARAETLGAWLLEQAKGKDGPVLALSENAVDLGLLTLASFHVGIPIATISTAYSLISSDHAKLKAMVTLLDPAVVFVSSTATYAKALAAIAPHHSGVLLASKTDDDLDATLFENANRDDKDAVARANAAIGPDTLARLLFTSGSTGTPKAVINTHKMLTSNQEAHREIWVYQRDKPPVIVDWLPWSHTFGANFAFNMVLRNGGSLYIDDGKPAPGIIARTIANIKDVRPNMALNVPRGFEILTEAMDEDAELREAFYAMDVCLCAAAALPASTWTKLRRQSTETTGRELPVATAWGSTETAPLATHCHFPVDSVANIGLPVPGVTLKLVPNGTKLEVRVKGPNITPGYFKNPEKTREAFDDEGFYMMGDALRLADPDDPSKGLFFDGRVVEDFKLTTGTWVSVGSLRVTAIDHLSPCVQDIVVAGHNRDEVGFLLIPNEPACRRVAGLAEGAPLADVLATDAVRAQVREGLKALKAAQSGSSMHAKRARFLVAPPNPDTGEITDKAYLNQRQILENRGGEVELLFGEDEGNIYPAA